MKTKSMTGYRKYLLEVLLLFGTDKYIRYDQLSRNYHSKARGYGHVYYVSLINEGMRDAGWYLSDLGVKYIQRAEKNDAERAE